MFKVRWAVAGLVLGLMAVEPLSAQELAQSRARIGSLSYEIYDVNPNDGVAARAEFLDPSNAWRTQLLIDTRRNLYLSPGAIFADDVESLASGVDVKFSTHGTTIAPVASSVGVFPSENLGVAGGSLSTAQPLIAAQGVSLSRGTSYTAFGGLSTTATVDLSATFYNLILGPGTGVRIGAYGIAEVWLSDSGAFAQASAELFARFSPRGANGEFQQPLQVTRSEAVDAYIDLYDPEFTVPHGALIKRESAGLLSLVYENLSSEDQIGRVRFAANANGESLAPVPEPQTWMMVLLGLPLLGAAVRGLRSARA